MALNGGSATCTTTALGGGTHGILAAYSGSVSDGGPYTVALVDTGTCTLVASQAGDADYQATSTSVSFQIAAPYMAIPVPSGGWPSRFMLMLGAIALAATNWRRRSMQR